MAKRDQGSARTKGGTTTKVSGDTTASNKRPAAAAVLERTEERGAVDAPGKRHRKALPSDPDASLADSQAAKMRMAKTMVKTKKLRGRG